MKFPKLTINLKKLLIATMAVGILILLVWYLNLSEVKWQGGINFVREFTFDRSQLKVDLHDDWLDMNFDWQSLNKVSIDSYLTNTLGSVVGAEYQAPEKLYPRGLNIAFVSDNFESFNEFRISIKGVIDNLKSAEPWKSYNDFNFFMIYNPDNSICAVQEENISVPLLKCSKQLIEILKPLPLLKVKVVVVSRRNFISWANITRFENSFVFYSLPKAKENDEFNKKIIFVELAHGFGMRDETRSVNAISGEAPSRPAGPNCAPTLEVAKKWWGDMVQRTSQGYFTFSDKNDVGFYFGCAGNNAYLRPTQKSFMNIQDFPDANSYGPVSEQYLKKVLDYCFSKKIYQKKDDPAFFEQYPEFKECLLKG